MKLKFVTAKTSLAKTIHEWWTPAFPSWFKHLKIPEAEAIVSDHRTVRQCPAFVHLFKNAHVIRAPQDISMHRNDSGEIGSKHPNGTEQVQVSRFDFDDMMGKEWAKYDSVKIDIMGALVPDQDMAPLFFDPAYHRDERMPLTTMTGVYPLYPTLFSFLGINMMGSKECFDENGYLHIPRGTPLAYMYWPQGKPVIEAEVVSEDKFRSDYCYVHTNFVGDFIKKEKELKNAV